MREREREEVNSSERKRSIFWMTHTMEKRKVAIEVTVIDRHEEKMERNYNSFTFFPRLFLGDEEKFEHEMFDLC